MNEFDLRPLLDCIDPSALDYQDWVSVGMGLKEAGYTANVWEEWSRRDAKRYHPGECFRKWETFNGSGNPVTGGTIVAMAQKAGWRPPRPEGHVLGWDDDIGSHKDDGAVVDRNWLEPQEVAEPKAWHPAQQLITYLETLFDSTENVGYVTKSFERDGKHMPTKGCCDRTAGQLIQELSKCGEDVGKVLGDYDPNVGAWIRFNPLDGVGVKNENVTDWKYALVESDSMPIEEQNAVMRALELPIACLVHSGGKSLHAIVRIEAPNYEEYRRRVDYLYQVCEKNGLKLDRQNRNPSRLSRMPGVTRKGKKQYLVDTDIGRGSWAEWKEWIEAINDDLPDTEDLSAVWNMLPELAPPLIDGVLRQGHKMLLTGPSKAAKSFTLIELVIAIAEGLVWLGRFRCAQGKVLYVNLELDRASCLHRFRDVYTAMGIPPGNLQNISVWNLRGKSVPMDKLAPKLIRRAAKMGYTAIVIDPIYKVITGDENSADQMAAFCNQFDKICTELVCAVIYCHHHSKGAQGGKRSMDRASGSGVFARDPDALLDMIELEVSDALRTQIENNAVAAACAGALDAAGKGHLAGLDDRCSQKVMLEMCERNLPPEVYMPRVEAARKASQARTAWRIESTLREFPRFPPVNVWFDYPVHLPDENGVLADIKPEAELPPWKQNFKKKKSEKERKQDRKDAVETAYEACSIDEQITLESLAKYMGVSEKTVRRRLKEHGDFEVDGSVVTRTNSK